MVAVVVGALVVTGVVVTRALVARATSDEARIRTLVSQFAVAVDTEDQDGVLTLLCAEEAEDVRDDDDYDPSHPPLPDPPPRRAVEVADIRVEGDVASARITRPDQPGTTLWFRKEADRWTVCAYAEGDAAASSAATP